MKSIAVLFAALLVTISFGCKKDITGCADPKADNYNPNATKSDPTQCTYLANTNGNGSGDGNGTGSTTGNDTIIQGCMNPRGENYDPEATIPGFCVIKGCSDENASNYDPEVTIHIADSCDLAGCTNPKSLNYNPNATTDDGSCIDARELYVGTWDVTDDCEALLGVGDPQDITYNSTGEDSIYFDAIAVGGTGFGLVNFTQVTIPSQVVNGTLTNATIDGQGTLDTNTNIMTINLNYSMQIPFIGTRAGSCVLTYTKQ